MHQKNQIPVKDTAASCNLFSGRWVFDDVSYPLYKEQKCSFLSDSYTDFACEKYGRKDVRYQSWRWQPSHCDLPRFSGTKLLEKIRGKTLAFVGDSLGRNQYTSLLCMLESSLPRSSEKSLIKDGNFAIFRSTEYNATIKFYWSPFLVESDRDDPFHHAKPQPYIIRISAIEKHARHWNEADILIFDTFAWWVSPVMTILWGSFGSPDAIYKNVQMFPRRYEMALNTWSDWLEININRSKTTMFFRSPSPSHAVWDQKLLRDSCYGVTEPILEEGYRGMTTNIHI